LIELFIILVFILLGCCIGIITGLIPGLHVNNLSLILLSATPVFLSSMHFLTKFDLSPDFILLLLCILIVAISMVHTFINFIPGAFFGASEGGRALSVLPAHAMVLEGRGYEAVYLSAVGSIGAVIFVFIFLLPYRFLIGPPIGLYGILKENMAYILLFLSAVLLFTEGRRIPYKKVLVVKDRMINRAVTDKNASMSATHEYNTRRKYDTKRKSNTLNLEVGEEYEINGKVTKIVDDEHYYLRCEYGEIFVKDKSETLVKDKSENLNRSNAEGYQDTDKDKERVSQGVELTITGSVQRIAWTYSRTLGVICAIFVFVVSGLFGYVALALYPESPFNLPSSVLFPMLTGMFGISTMISSLKETSVVPKQTISTTHLNKSETVKSVMLGSVAGSISGFLPGISDSHTTVLSSLFRKKHRKEQVIVSISSINASNAIFTLIALFLILKPRSGIAMTVDQLLLVEAWNGILPPQALIYLLMAVLAASVISYFSTILIGKKFALLLNKMPYKKMLAGIILFVTASVFIFNGMLGLFILFVSTCLGFIAPYLGVRRSHAMGVLLLPIMIKFPIW